LDGRYRSVVKSLVDFFSEPALNRARLQVEVEWIIHLAATGALPGLPQLTEECVDFLKAIAATFASAEIAELAGIEQQTVHDVKAVEYFLQRRLDSPSCPPALSQPGIAEAIHFGLTSEDVNNLAYGLMVRDGLQRAWRPLAQTLINQLIDLASAYADQPMLARTHGQPATPTTLGKELAVFAYRLKRQLDRIDQTCFLGKISGATGTYGALVVAVPTTDWPTVARSFVEHLGLTWHPLTTQLDSHDWQAELYADLSRFGRIAHNLATDIWTYISLGYFRQARGQGTVGSSTMPHKVNPIRFENAEANLEISASLFDTLAATLVTSRMQRDLTDSTSQRNIGVAFGHSMLALDNLSRGLAGLDVDTAAMLADLDTNWEVLTEPIQSAMRAVAVTGRPGFNNPYERLKDFSRGKRIGKAEISSFISSLALPQDVADRLLELTPDTYTGLAGQLVRQYLPPKEET
jgi:adenylosuccinate lyase